MNAINDFIVHNLGLVGVGGFALFLAKDFVRDFLARDGQARLANSDPKDDALGRAELSAAQALDKIPNPRV